MSNAIVTDAVMCLGREIGRELSWIVNFCHRHSSLVTTETILLCPVNCLSRDPCIYHRFYKKNFSLSLLIVTRECFNPLFAEDYNLSALFNELNNYESVLGDAH